MNTKLRCLLLDDELPGLTYLRMLCEQISGVEVLRSFNDPIKFIEEAPKLEYDLCILDIEMPGMSGVEVAKQIGSKPIIFTTAYKEYAAEAFDLEAIDYIRKPITRERLEKAISKAIERLKKNAFPKRQLLLNTSKGRSLINYDQIVYVTIAENDTRDKYIYLVDGQKLLAKNISFEVLLEQLPTNEFARVNKKEVLSLNAVRFFVHNEVVISFPGCDEKRLSLSDSYRNEFLGKLGR